MRGPRGTGLLYIRESLLPELEPPLLDIRAATLTSPATYEIPGDVKRFENWEQYCAGKYALGKAVDYALSWGLDSIQKRVYSLADILRRKLSAIDGITVTDEGVEKCGIVTFVSQQLDPADIKTALTAHKINVSTSLGSGSLVSFQERGLAEVVRASLHYFNTKEEIDYFTATLSKLFRNPIGA